MKTVKRVHVIACGVLAIDLKSVAQRLGIDVSMEFLPGGLHSTPHELRRRLQAAIDDASAKQRGDMIAVGYGVCGLGAVGIRARHTPLAIPRVHDCIAMFLGSDAAYREQFAHYPGTYYIAAGWVEEKVQPKSMDDAVPAKCERESPHYQAWVEKFGRENADKITDFHNSWQRNYQRAAFIDTGVAGRRERYARVAKDMAEKLGWKYEELAGTGDLLTALLKTRSTTDDILIVPPHHVTAYDAVGKGLKAVPIWQDPDAAAERSHTLVFEREEDAAAREKAPPVRFGLGIDAGGTYTDAVIYAFETQTVLRKAKALTTPWEYTLGIDNALDQLDPDQLKQVDLVSISTTLATNAIVEGRGQKVALLIMPPYGLYDEGDVTHRPLALLDGRMEIDGAEIAPVDPDQVRRVARDMAEREQVRAFAVTAFASCINPAHEIEVRDLIHEETGLGVTCGHEVSELLNYRVRAETAALNARIIPYLDTLLDRTQGCLARRGIRAPVMVVKSDGSLMSVQAARRRPVETILSGPAASVAGARFLVGSPDAVVVDIGGTTTDTAIISAGAVQTCEQGATVGGRKTHVKALNMRTLGLGGDSLIAYEHRKLHIGPRRVAPVSWLAAGHGHAGHALEWLKRHLDHFDASTRPMDVIALNGRDHELSLTEKESRVFDLLLERPRSVHELSVRVNGESWPAAPLDTLEENHLIQRCALTPTDLLHVTGELDLWDVDAARRLCELFARLVGATARDFADRTLRQVVKKLAVELIKKQIEGEVEPDTLEDSPVAMALVNNFLEGGSEAYRVHVALARPVIGIGAPAHSFLPQAAALLETEAVIPPHADVANAIGAVTSSVSIHKRAGIAPNDLGRYAVSGLPDAPTFADFEDAHQFALDYLQRTVRVMARNAGTAETRVEIGIHDHIAPIADGSQVFIGRTFEARLTGRPDLAHQPSDS